MRSFGRRLLQGGLENAERVGPDFPAIAWAMRGCRDGHYWVGTACKRAGQKQKPNGMGLGEAGTHSPTPRNTRAGNPALHTRAQCIRILLTRVSMHACGNPFALETNALRAARTRAHTHTGPLPLGLVLAEDLDAGVQRPCWGSCN